MKRRKRARLDHPLTMDSVLRTHGDQRFSKVLLPIPHGVWRNVVGTRVSLRAVPAAIENGTLVVRVATSAWAQELSLHAETLCERLREAGFAVSRIRFRVGEVVGHERPKERMVVTKVPIPVAIPESVEQALASTKDDDLREVLSESVAASLALQLPRS